MNQKSIHAWRGSTVLMAHQQGSEPVALQRDPTPRTTGNCRRRGGSGCGGVSRMDAATELTWTYLQRPPQPDPPRQPTESQLLTLLRLVAGAGLQSPATKPSLTVARPPRRIPRLILICCCAGCGRQPSGPSSFDRSCFNRRFAVRLVCVLTQIDMAVAASARTSSKGLSSNGTNCAG